MMLDELFHSNRLQHGQKIILSVPESSRFSYVYALLTVEGGSRQ
jgi:3-oxoacyl-[acyl-carrier-protein] synthase III